MISRQWKPAHRWITALLSSGIATESYTVPLSAEYRQKRIGSNDRKSERILSSLATQILHLEKLIQQQKRFLEKNYSEARRQIELLLTFKGIGVYSAVGLLLNIVDIRRFPTVKHLSAYFEIRPVYKKSGDGVWGMHMSKKDRSEPRAILYMIAWSGIQHNPLIKKCYVHSMSKGMNRRAAIGVCMHKILRIIYGMLKNNTPFDPAIDDENQKTTVSGVFTTSQKARRFQKFDKNSPTSRRQYKKEGNKLRPKTKVSSRAGSWNLFPLSNFQV